MGAVRSVCFGLTIFIGAITLEQYQYDTYIFSKKEQAAFEAEFCSGNDTNNDDEVADDE